MRIMAKGKYGILANCDYLIKIPARESLGEEHVTEIEQIEGMIATLSCMIRESSKIEGKNLMQIALLERYIGAFLETGMERGLKQSATKNKLRACVDFAVLDRLLSEERDNLQRALPTVGELESNVDVGLLCENLRSDKFLYLDVDNKLLWSSLSKLSSGMAVCLAIVLPYGIFTSNYAIYLCAFHVIGWLALIAIILRHGKFSSEFYKTLESCKQNIREASKLENNTTLVESLNIIASINILISTVLSSDEVISLQTILAGLDQLSSGPLKDYPKADADFSAAIETSLKDPIARELIKIAASYITANPSNTQRILSADELVALAASYVKAIAADDLDSQIYQRNQIETMLLGSKTTLPEYHISDNSVVFEQTAVAPAFVISS